MSSRLKNSDSRKIVLPVKKEVSHKQEKKKPIPDSYEFLSIDLIDIESNIRSEYSEESINELAESIKHYGQLEPILIYENKNRYNIIFGHRRYLACKKAGVDGIKCIVTQKPDTLDKIYIQATENLQSEKISPSDFENFVTLLKKKHGQSVETIAEKLHKKKTWIYDILNAPKIREKYEKSFNDSGIFLSTRDTTLISSASEDEVKEAVSRIVENPGSKTNILNELHKKKTKKKGNRTAKISSFKSVPEEDNDEQIDIIHSDNSDISSTEENNTITVNDIEDDIIDNNTSQPTTISSKSINVELKLNINEDDKIVKIKPIILGDIYDSKIIPLLLNALESYYTQEGYNVEK